MPVRASAGRVMIVFKVQAEPIRHRKRAATDIRRNGRGAECRVASTATRTGRSRSACKKDHAEDDIGVKLIVASA